MEKAQQKLDFFDSLRLPIRKPVFDAMILISRAARENQVTALRAIAGEGGLPRSALPPSQ